MKTPSHGTRTGRRGPRDLDAGDAPVGVYKSTQRYVCMCVYVLAVDERSWVIYKFSGPYSIRNPVAGLKLAWPVCTLGITAARGFAR